MFDVYSSTFRSGNGEVELTVTDHGPSDGKPVLLLHGFPDSAALWRHQIPALAGAGYRVLAPDLRGFGHSDKPEDATQYRMSLLAGDIEAVLDEARVDRVHMVGHDWGAALTWYMAMIKPSKVKTLTALSVGHPLAFKDAGIRQMARSWYMLLFQAEGTAERWLSRDDWAMFRQWSAAGTDLDRWIEDLSRPGALTAALNIYRANMTPEIMTAPAPDLPRVEAPVMGIWSARDGALLETQMTGSRAYVDGEFCYERIDDVSHWIPVDAPEQTNTLLIDWLKRHQ